MVGLRHGCCVLAVVAATVQAAPAWAADDRSLKAAALSQAALAPVDASDEDSPSGRTAGQGCPGQTCDLVSEDDTGFFVSNRFRGNIFELSYPGTLESFAIQLEFTTAIPIPLYYMILSRPIGGSGFTRYINDIQVSTLGQGRRFYGPQGNLDLDLVAGREYAIGVAWGPTSIMNRRDTGSFNLYPLPFPLDANEPRGRTMGSFTVLLDALLGEPPLVIPEEGFPLGVNRDMANFMRLCFTPERGACCCGGTGGCRQLCMEDCAAVGGFFRGERLACADAACDCGACCLPCDGECLSDYERFACLEAGDGATFLGDNTSCNDAGTDCPVRTGACCNDFGCSEVCHDACDTAQGSFLGVGSTCFPVNPCFGACCEFVDPDVAMENGICENVSRDACIDAEGEFKGEGTTCSTLPSSEECGGACCRGASPCIVVSNRLRCELQFHGKYLGDATECPDTSPPNNMVECDDFVFGACCISNGDCLVTTQDFCSEPWIGGVFFAASPSCEPYPCDPLPLGACCLGDGSCLPNQTSPDCVASNGTFRLAGTCDPNTCSAPRGACCTATGCVGNRTEAACLAPPLNGVYRGDRSTCTVPCPSAQGACCFAMDRLCEQLTPTQCQADGGTYRGDGETCSICLPAAGACCFADGECVEDQTSTQCTADGGMYRGDRTDCSPNPCPQPMGACCSPISGLCSVVTQMVCTSQLGVYRGNGTDCDPNECPQPVGACCFSDGSPCTVGSSAACSTAEGSYQGNNSDCDPNPCQPPMMRACCFSDGDCEITTQVGCAAQGGVYHPNDIICGAATCPQPMGACCSVSTGACSITTQPACVAPNNLYQGHDTDCDENPCPQPMGACCYSDGRTCMVQTPAACTDSSGNYLGNNSVCANCPAPDMGVCCANDGGCTVTTPVGCQAQEGEFDTDVEVCEPNNPCPQPQACCFEDGSDCQVLVPVECEAAGGTTQDSPTCGAGICPAACCFDDSRECEMLSLADCLDADGTHLGDDTTCDPKPCERACCLPCGQCQVVNETMCEAIDGTFKPQFANCGGDILNCEFFVGACCNNGVCSELCKDACSDAGGTYAGDETTCGETACINIIGSDPEGGTIDARQPSDLDGINPAGFDRVMLTFDGDATLVEADNFLFSATPPGGEPTFAAVIPDVNPTKVTVVFSAPIPAGKWSKLTYVPTNSSRCLGFLPGDINGNRDTQSVESGEAAADVQALVDCLGGGGMCASPHQTDINQSSMFTPLDLMRAIDILIGADGYANLERTLPGSPCQ